MLYEIAYTLSRTMISGEPFWPIFKFAQVKSQLGPVCEELDKRKINLEKLVVNGTGSLVDVFHQDSIYSNVELFGFLSKPNGEPTTGVVRVEGVRPRFAGESYFDLNIAYLPLGFKVGEDDFDKIKPVEEYLQQRLAAQRIHLHL